MTRDMVVVGASTGGVRALRALAAELPEGFPAAVLVVQHTLADVRSSLPEILSRAGALPATHALHGEQARPGRIYVAPPDHHLLLGKGGRLGLSHGARENHHRPAVDVLFRSAARSHRERVIGVILTGALGDGAAGLREVVERGGVAVVQDPDDAESPSMPLRALESVRADHVLPLAAIPDLLTRLAGTPGEIRPPGPPPEEHAVRREPPSALTCPECGGALWETSPEGPRFRCHVGHAYDGGTLLAIRSEQIEQALWSAVRQMEERRMLLERLAADAERRGHLLSARRYRVRGGEVGRSAAVLRDLLEAPAAEPPGVERKGSAS